MEYGLHCQAFHSHITCSIQMFGKIEFLDLVTYLSVKNHKFLNYIPRSICGVTIYIICKSI